MSICELFPFCGQTDFGHDDWEREGRDPDSDGEAGRVTLGGSYKIAGLVAKPFGHRFTDANFGIFGPNQPVIATHHGHACQRHGYEGSDLGSA